LPGSQKPSPSLILASASPRRLALLRQVGIEPDGIEVAGLSETPRAHELPQDYALRLAREKARAVAERHPGAYVLGADTVVACGRRILPKVETVTEAAKCLALLSGRRHRVLTALCLLDPAGRARTRVVETHVRMKRLSEAERANYLVSGEWQGKAGGYAIQGRAGAFVRFLNGSYTNVVGLPLFETLALLKSCG
jgi:septum formation protein